jgi:Flp pilus assembly protein CpaB
MGESLDPSLLSRLHELRPDWTRTVAARRAAAGALVVLAAVAALRPDPSDGRADVVVAARDLAPGIELTDADLRVESRLATAIPDGSATATDDLLGATLTGPARRGEVLTDVRVLSSRLAGASVGADARIVPVHPTDTALLELVRPGDVVDVLAVSEAAEERARMVATDAIVVLVSPKAREAGRDGVVLIALPVSAANDVAAASLTQAITLTFH